MNDKLVFNHHALPFDSPDAADAAMPGFLSLGLRAQRAGFGVILVDEHLDAKWFRIELAIGYFWQDWHDRHSKKDEKKEMIRAFRSIATHQPFFSPEDMEEGCNLREVCVSGTKQSLDALLAAIWHDAPLLGFPTRLPWNRSPVAVTVQRLDEDEEIRETTAEIVNLCSLVVWAENERDFLRERIAAIQSGRALIEQWESLFPALGHCGKAPTQLAKWSQDLSLLDEVKAALTVLNNFSEQWREGKISIYTHDALRDMGLNHEVSGESESVCKDSKLRKKREFRLPSGIKEYFENHVKLRQRFRLHFFPDAESRMIFVGYIGPHLPLR